MRAAEWPPEPRTATLDTASRRFRPPSWPGAWRRVYGRSPSRFPKRWWMSVAGRSSTTSWPCSPAHGIRRVVLCLGYLGDQVEKYLGDGSAHGMEIGYSYDGPQLLGTGGALRRAAPLLGEVFWVMYGDSYMDIDYRAVLGRVPGTGSPWALMTVLHNQNRWDRSNVVFRDGRLVKYDKRVWTPEMTHVDYGVALLRRTALERISPHQPSDLADLYASLVAEGQMIGYEVTPRFYEIGSPEGLRRRRVRTSRVGCRLRLSELPNVLQPHAANHRSEGFA